MAELCVALDSSDLQFIRSLARSLRGVCSWVKVGLQPFAAGGPSLAEELADDGWNVFLDLKLHDIPRTVAEAAAECSRLGVAMITVHASGGRRMVEAAVEGAARFVPRPKVVAVTVLTSLDEEALKEIGFSGSTQDAVQRLAKLAMSAGADGVVCSPKEVSSLRESLGEGALLVVPGIRPAGYARGDQARVATPEEAAAAGADLLVVGRPITQAEDPAKAAEEIASSITKGAGK